MELKLKIYFLIAIMPLILGMHASQCMSSKELPVAHAHEALSQEPLTCWPRFLYDDAFPGINSFIAMSENFDSVVAQSLKLTKFEADKQGMPEKERRMYDWVFTLFQTENTLLLKPFLAWTCDDVVTVARMLTRLSNDEPGALRDDTRAWLFVKLSPEGIQKFASLPAPVADASNFSLENGYFCSKRGGNPFTVTAQLALALHITQQSIKRNMNAIFDWAAFLHFSLLKILPFAHGNNRLARFIVHLIIAQKGASPFIFSDKIRYIKALKDECTKKINLADLAKPPTSILGFYFIHLFAHTQALLANLSQSSQQAINDRAIFKEAVKSFSESIREKNLMHCAFCDVDSGKKQLFTCTSCKQLAYCSKDCQKKDWPQHKDRCNKNRVNKKNPSGK